MQGVEKQVLNIIKQRKEAKIESIAGKLGISTKYTSEICSTLVNDGYLENPQNGKFKLTLKGKEFVRPAMKARKPLIRW